MDEILPSSKQPSAKLSLRIAESTDIKETAEVAKLLTFIAKVGAGLLNVGETVSAGLLLIVGDAVGAGLLLIVGDAVGVEFLGFDAIVSEEIAAGLIFEGTIPADFSSTEGRWEVKSVDFASTLRSSEARERLKRRGRERESRSRPRSGMWIRPLTCKGLGCKEG